MLINGLPSSCSGCYLSTNPKCGFFTKIEGKGHSGVLIIGEASGEHEGEDGLPFRPQAPAGSILEAAIRKGGGKRDDYWITNIIRCRPPNNVLAGAAYERESIAHCSHNLRRAIEEYKPRAILALGTIPLRELTGRSGGKESISYLRGFCLPGPGGIPVIPSLHPAFTARGNTRLLPLLIKDLMSAKSAASGRLTYVVDPSIEMEALEGLKALEKLYLEAIKDPHIWIAYDIETEQSLKGDEDELVEIEERDRRDNQYSESGMGDDPDSMGDGIATERIDEESSSNQERPTERIDLLRSRIISIQFAISDRWGVFGDWKDERIRDLAQRILALPNPKVAHNGDHFDRPILEREGVIINGDHYDSLSMRRALQPDLPAGLQQVAVDYGWRWPWKHYSGSNAILYGVADVCSLVRIMSKLPLELDKLGMWEGYVRYIRETRDKVEIPWEKRGIPMSVQRLDEFRSELTSQVLLKSEEMFPLIPEELHSKHPEEGYKILPEDVRKWIKGVWYWRFLDTTKTLKNGTKKRVKNKTKVFDVFTDLLEDPVGMQNLLLRFPRLTLGKFGEASRLYELVPFNPRSSQQMIKYLKHKGYEVPKTFKEGKETTGDKLMKRLQDQTKDPVIALSREIRALEKMRDSYTGKVRENGVAEGGWIPDGDGRLRTRAMTNSTWQFSSVSPNVFTLPKRRGDLANGFRRCVAAEPGHLLVEFDYKAFHDLTTAALASDDRKWRTAKIDPHSYVAGWLVRYPGISKALEMSDSDLKEYLLEIKKKYKKVRDEQAKPLNHGTNFGQSYRRLFFENEEYFESEAQAKQMLDMLKGIYPKTFQWQTNLLESLKKTPYLQSVWGARRWLWDVWTWKRTQDGRWYEAKGQDAEKALAFLPANHAHGMFRMKLLEMAELGYLDKYELVMFPHDAMVFHPSIDLADECISNVREWLEAPVKELANPILCPDGFSCGTDCAIGPSMGEMEEVK